MATSTTITTNTNDRSLKVKLRVEIAGANIVIDDLDISVNIKRNDKGDPNICEVGIYNLSDRTYSILADKTTGARIFYSYRDSPFQLIFQGTKRKLLKVKKKKKRVLIAGAHKPKAKKKKKSIYAPELHYYEPSVQQEMDGADTLTKLILTESSYDCQTAFFSKTYKGKVTSAQILSDVISKMGTPIGKIGKIKTRVYYDKTFHQSCTHLLTWVCETIGARWSMQQNSLFICDKKENKAIQVASFDETNIARPDYQKDKQIDIDAQFIPFLKPEDWVNLSNKMLGIDDMYQITETESEVDNFGKKFETKLTLKDNV